MTHERISFSGTPVVGFGGGDVSLKSLDKPLIGFLVGVTGGAIVGALIGKGAGAAIGAMVGAIGGGAAGFALEDAHAAQSSTPASSTGEIYAISLSGVRATATVDEVGTALAHAMAWNMDTIEDGVLTRYPQGAVLTIGFKSNATTPPLPSVNFSFKVGEVHATVTAVTRAPAKIQ